jgi:hypothetical protein
MIFTLLNKYLADTLILHLAYYNGKVFFRLGKVNADKYVKEALNSPLTADSCVKVSNDLTSPSAAAALAFMKSVAKDELCGLPTEVYLQTIFSGKIKEKANAEATKIYIEAYNNGERLPQEGACAEADAAYREASGMEMILSWSLLWLS